MVTVQNILFPTDFSENSSAALVYAVDLAGKYGAALHIVHVTHSNTQHVAFDFSEYVPEDVRNKQHESLEQTLHALPPAELGSPETVRHEILEGVPFYEILAYVQKHGIDLLVMGTHGRTGLKHLAMGSVAENVVRNARIPVLTVHSGSS